MINASVAAALVAIHSVRSSLSAAGVWRGAAATGASLTPVAAALQLAPPPLGCQQCDSSGRSGGAAVWAGRDEHAHRRSLDLLDAVGRERYAATVVEAGAEQQPLAAAAVSVGRNIHFTTETRLKRIADLRGKANAEL